MARIAESQAIHRLRKSSQPIRYVNGTTAAERITMGTCPARQVSPKIAMNPAATMEVSGIQ